MSPQSRDRFFYQALQREPSSVELLFRRLRMLTGPQRALLLLPIVALATGVLIGRAVLEGAPRAGWIKTGTAELRLFAPLPAAVDIDQGSQGPRLRFEGESLIVKYRPQAARQQLQLFTPHGVVVSRGGVFLVEVAAARTVVGVQRGEVAVFTGGEARHLMGAGERGAFTSEGPSPKPVPATAVAMLSTVFPSPLERLEGVSPIVSQPTSAPAPTVLPEQKSAATPEVRRTATKPRPKRSRLLPRKRPAQRRPEAERGAAPAIAAHTAYDEEAAPAPRSSTESIDLGAPVLVPLEEAWPPPAPSAMAQRRNEPVDAPPSHGSLAPAPAEEPPKRTTPPRSDKVFEAPSSWWE